MPFFCITRHSSAFDRSDVAFYDVSIRKKHILKASDAKVARKIMTAIYPNDQEFCVSIATKEQIAGVDFSTPKRTCDRCNKTKDHTDEFFFVSSNKSVKFCRQCMNELSTQKKKCPRCRKNHPMTIAYWFTARDRLDGFHTPCKDCYHKSKSESRKRKKNNEDSSQSISN